MADYRSVVIYLEELGLTDVLIPFILIFTICFAMLQRTHVLGKGKVKYNVIVAVVMSLFVVIPHAAGLYSPERDIVTLINTALPRIALLIVAVVFLLLLIGGAGTPVGFKTGDVGVGAFGMAVLFFLNFAFPQIPWFIPFVSVITVWAVWAFISGGSWKSWLVFFCLCILMYIIGAGMGLFTNLPDWFADSRIRAPLTVLAVVLVLVTYITKLGGEKDNQLG